MKEKKEKCKHPKIPSYNEQEAVQAAALIDLINQGDPDIISYDERSFKVVTD